MTRVEQERLVGNYLRGEMSAAEEQEFFIQVALDSDLRQTLKAFRVVDAAIRKHREAISPHHAESYQRLMAMLGSAAKEPAAVIATTATSALRQGISALGARFFTWTTALVATGALSIGTLVLGPAINSGDSTEGTQETTRVESPQTISATSDRTALLPDGSRTLRTAQQRAEEVTTGSARKVPTGTSSEISETQKSSTHLDPEAIIGDARKKVLSEENRNVFSPEMESNNIDESPESVISDAATKKPKVNINYLNMSTEPMKDTINLSVDFNKEGIKRR